MIPLITPEQGSAIIAVIQFSFALLALPTILNPASQVPRLQSIPTAVGLWLLALVFLAMGPLLLAAGMSAFCATAWTLIAILRPVQEET